MTPKELMARINEDCPQAKIAAAITGGGTEAIGEMLRYGGSSQTVLYAYVPYSPIFTEQYLGRSPDKLCSAESARMLAMKAYHDVVQFFGYQDGEIHPVGIGATSALGKITKEREGREHKIYVAVQTRDKTITYELFLTASRTREEEERVNAMLVLSALGDACNLPLDCDVDLGLHRRERVDVKTDEGVVLEQVLCGESPFSVYGNEGLVTVKGSTGHVKLLLPASFHPIHEAHREMARIASEMTGNTCHYEMSIINADKPPLTYTEIYSRLDYFDQQVDFGSKNEGDLWITRLPTFVEKAREFAPVTFVVGADTARRICDPRFYGDSERNMLAALTEMRDLGVKFVCFARKVDGEICSGISDDTPEIFRTMAETVDPQTFVSDVSSTEIRRSKVR